MNVLSKKVKAFATCLLLFGSLLQVKAQKTANNPVNYLRTDLVAPSATAGTLGRYGDASVNQSSGAPNLSIPIFTIGGQELSVPIVLSYSYDGFKPVQPIAWTGLGWNLQAGGVITRQIKGRVDNTANQDYNFQDSYVQSRIVANGGYETSAMQTFLDNVADGLIDGEPDVYNFNFGGYSGRFTLVNGVYSIFPYQKLKISGSVGNFTITTEDGIKYYFSDAEYTNPKAANPTGYNIPPHQSAWYLTSITNASNTEAIRFLYQTESAYAQLGTNTQTYKKVEDFSSGGSSELYPPYNGFSTYITPLRLTSIISEKQTVNFLGTSAGREDMSTGSKALGSITVTDNNSGNIVKNFRLKYGYFGAGASNYLSKYLKLKSLEELPMWQDGEVVDTTKKQVHTFEYDNEAGGYPNKAEAFVDHFGYYAGGIFGTIMIPNTVYPQGPDRSPNPTTTQNGALKKITYPTGGNTVFEYENNVGYNGSNYVQLQYTKEALTYRPSNDQTGSYTSNFGTGVFTLNKDQTIVVQVTRQPKSIYTDSNSRNLATDVKLYKQLAGGGFEVYATIMISHERDNVGSLYYYPVEAGTYAIEVSIDSRELSMYASVGYSADSSTPIEGKTTGGLRIKRITNNPVIGLPTIKSYRYTDARGFSSGSPMAEVYDQRPFSAVTVSALNQETTVNSVNYSSFIAEGANGGQPNFYRSVYEDIIGGTDTLTTRSDYVSFSADFNGIQPSSLIQYKRTPSGLVPVKKTEYEYGEQGMGGVVGVKAYKDREVTITPGGQYPPPFFHYTAELSMLNSYWLYTKKTKEVSYEGTDSLVTVTNNSYDLADTKNLMMTKTVASNGDQLIGKFKYPENYTSGVSGAFTAAHVLRPAWEQQTWRKTGTDSVLVSAGITEYSASNFKPVKQYALTAKGIAALNGEGMSGTKYSSLLSDSRYEERVAYSYDGAGRLQTQQLTGGVPVSYQWGYLSNVAYSTSLGQKNYVVAEVKNALPTEFYFENYEDNSSATVGRGHSGIRYVNGDVPVSVVMPVGRSYIISYWYLDGTIWKYTEQPYSGSAMLTLGSAIDDIAIFPKDAQLSSYGYLPSVGISTSTDAKGLTTYSEFDEFNRLKNIRDQDGNIVKNYNYNFAHLDLAYYNVAVSGNFTKNNCSSGTGSTVTYTIPANTYSASTQAAADALASSALASGGQAYANTNGTCSAASTALHYQNFTTQVTPGGAYSAEVSSLTIKDGSGNILYTFSNSQLKTGVTVPQGTYTFVFGITGGTWNPSNNMGWAACYVTSNSGAYFSGFDTTTTTYTITGVTLVGEHSYVTITNTLMID
ncbi:DUF5977 domain-containing protein [Pedobacter sp. KR3-3]|uniref:DUF5977 domain-containing protein n=1 Tax=Pedobacter albus TaxID=3113905 RepID=A0ABU7I552_9SPHI|nr:DUF5977 domain-containing protein [Pedobacter sp. KR3-3]MEE1944594.1 DUF5977 domain-containing protein [Pedobacter sp. KR3-3]